MDSIPGCRLTDYQQHGLIRTSTDWQARLIADWASAPGLGIGAQERGKVQTGMRNQGSRHARAAAVGRAGSRLRPTVPPIASIRVSARRNAQLFDGPRRLERPRRPIAGRLNGLPRAYGSAIALPALLLAFLALTAAPALAAPTWGIEMTHENAYGTQGGVDPYTHSGTTFDRESGFNAYTITVKNTGTGTAGGYGVGDTLSCEGGPSSGAALTYRWLRNGAVIAGATGSAYQIQSADKGAALQCEVTASSAEGATVAVSNSSQAAPIPSTPPPAGGYAHAYASSYPAQVGETKICETGNWTGSPTSYEFQWLRNGVAITGASSGQVSSTEFDYTLTAEDEGKAVQCEVTATNAGGSAAAASEGGEAAAVVAAVVATPPRASSVPTLSGTASVGETLTCSEGAWENSPTSYEFQWLRDGVAISGATVSTYTLKAPADEGKAIQCEVTAVNVEGATSAVSAQDVVSPPPSTTPPTNTEAPFLFASYVGETAFCFAESWKGEPTSYEFQWLRNGVAIAGASSGPVSSTEFYYLHTLTAEDEGKAIQCEVTATNAGGSVAAISNASVIGPKLPQLPNASATVPTRSVVSVSDQLPAGLVLAGEDTKSEASGEGWTCPIANPTTVTCTRSDALLPGASYPPITVHVHVNPTAPLGTPPGGGVTNVATVYGGGASPASASASDPTTIASVPFGVQSFTTSVTESLGNPFTQAGGHPFAANATFVFNYMPDDFGALKTAGGSPKDIETELPPGFVGNPQTTPKCPAATFAAEDTETPCPVDTAVGYLDLAYSGGRIIGGRAQPFYAGQEPRGLGVLAVYNLVPSPGHAATFGFIGGKSFAHFTLNAKVRSDGDYGITISSPYTTTPTVLGVSLTFCENGVTQGGGVFATFSCTPTSAGATPFLTNPSKCEGPAPVTTLRADTYENPAGYASMASYAGAPSAPPSFVGQPGTSGTPASSTSFVTGCNLLQFQPEVQFKPSQASEGGTSQADEPTGATFDLKVPQPEEDSTNATPELKSATVTLPEGMTVDPSAADGLQACSNAQFGLGATVEPAEPASCPPASQIGTVKVITPLLEKPLEGQVFLGAPECSPCRATDAEDGHIFRLFLQVRSAERGVLVKLAGHVSANPSTGRLQATFTQQPQLPFSELLLTFTGGARASLANPQTCGTFTTSTDLTPWSTPGLGGLSGTEAIAGTPDATPSSSFNVDWNGAGGACPGMPFSPSFSAGSQTPAAGAASPFSVTFGREDREQDISAITVSTPPGLLGEVSQVPQCAEAQANAGTCGPESLIGSTTVGAGPGPDPFYLSGKVYLTGPYKGAPFGLSIVVPAVAGPFNLGTVVVRASIAVNPSTAALTITSDALPQFVDGVQLRLRRINVEVNRPGFMLNPTSCAAQAVGATITAAQGASSTQSTPFQVGGCQNLPFTPSLAASTQAKTSKADGASLTVTVKSAAGQANIAKVDLQLPKVLPSRLTTLQKACLAAVFNANPAGCPEASDIGTARALTPILKAPLMGPAYLVSHGGAAFPDVEFVLQGEGVTIVLDGKTEIKNSITYSRFETVPDAPISSFETSLPEGPHSILGAYLPASANGSMCGQSLSMPTIITAQNGKQVKQTTKIAVTGCKASKPSVKITKTKLNGNTLLVTVKTSAKGTVKISGNDFKTTVKKNVNAGSHQIKLALSNAGKTAKKHRKRTKLRASLTVGKQAVANTISVKL
jgi:hypothetical protein